MSSLTPSTGAISVGNIVTSFPSVAAYNLNAYRGRTYYTGNNYQTATFSSGAITMADFYSTADTFTGFTSVTNYSIGTVGYPPNDQNGYAGYLNGRVSFSQTTGIYCTVDAWSADSQTGAGGTYQLATAAQILSGKTPQQGYYYNGAAQFSAGRDTSCIGFYLSWNNTNFIIQVYWAKKGNPFDGSYGGIVGQFNIYPYF